MPGFPPPGWEGGKRLSEKLHLDRTYSSYAGWALEARGWVAILHPVEPFREGFESMEL